MIGRFTARRHSPIGLDIGARSVRLVQFTSENSRLLEAARWDLPISAEADASARLQSQVEALRRAREGRAFRGRDAVVCLGADRLCVQNVRVAKTDQESMERLVHQEAASRVPFPIDEAEIRYVEASDIRQGDSVKREVIMIACHRPALDELLEIVESAGLTPISVDVEPAALLRSYQHQLRRDEDQNLRTLLVRISYEASVAMIAHGDEVLFVKYIGVGGRHLDEAVAQRFDLDLSQAAALRRRCERRDDEEVAHGVHDATRPVLEKLGQELSLCTRYHSVTFRGKPLETLVLGGADASPQVLESLKRRFPMDAILSDPLRDHSANDLGRRGQWDIAAGLALREELR